MKLTGEYARTAPGNAAQSLQAALGLTAASAVSAVQTGDSVWAGVSGLPFFAPCMPLFLNDPLLYPLWEACFAKGDSLLIQGDGTALAGKGGKSAPLSLSGEQLARIRELFSQVCNWGGKLNEKGELVCDLKSPSPGPSYYTNILIGNRIGFDRPLQSTPKGVTDRFGRGSFRGHADVAVLATRWDSLPEENGFPANRQFYLLENGKQIFYSGDAANPAVKNAVCTFSQNRTIIEYTLESGLKITRTIFLLPQYEGLPMAVECHRITVENTGAQDRALRLCCTGMFATCAPNALVEDVIYTTVICQSDVIRDENGNIAAVSYHNNPAWEQGNHRFHTLLVHGERGPAFPDQFCFSYPEFVGDGTLEHPENLARLSCRHTRKGPGFFAVSALLFVRAGQTVTADNFTGLCSEAVTPDYSEEAFHSQVAALIDRFSDPAQGENALRQTADFAGRYAAFLSVSDPDRDFESYVNQNLPYQVFYQTFASRAFDQTQKGYREIGFREIQDIFASMYYFCSMGRADFVKQLLREWISNVYEMGYANHDFYWAGKRPGVCSDDQLWLPQALDRYVKLTGDYEFLLEDCPMAGGGSRRIFDTVKAIIEYSGKISVGQHGLPLIDKADWNDTLNVDPNWVEGPEKERLYKEQLKQGGSWGDPFVSDQSESVMNGFLLKLAMDIAADMAGRLGDAAYQQEVRGLAEALAGRLQKHGYKNGMFARVLLNRPDSYTPYLGAAGDGLSVEGDEGTCFLNSFSWAILSGVAKEEQIRSMLEVLGRQLRTPYGFRLCTGVDYAKIAPQVGAALYYRGDRENGGVFKHANMMACAAMLQAASRVEDKDLAAELCRTAWWVIDVALPYKTLAHPFDTCGNPRLCTQYNNSETGESFPPTLSGTSTWLLLSLIAGFGLQFSKETLTLDPLLREEATGACFTVRDGQAIYKITVDKPKGFARVKEGCTVLVDGAPAGVSIPKFSDGKTHTVKVKLSAG